ncbi:MAG TPA: DUF1330 domain-containing protein [Solirubrobacteraceae bacterium]|nr:DUF1330 domain-containing protein [Solirubrobacteraceae bacterium]
MTVDPRGEDIRRFRDEDDGGPVVMLNLLRFAGEPGRASYAQYAARIQPFLDAVGATVLYAGSCSTVLVAPDEHRWDALLVVRYPSRAAFLQMVGDPDYQSITELRTAGLEAAVLQATTPWS